MADTIFYKTGTNQSVTISGELTSANYPSGYTSANIIKVEIGTDVTDISNNAFHSVSFLASVTFNSPSSVHTIGEGAFEWSGLTSVNIPNSVTSIGDTAFKNIVSLTLLTFESGSLLTTIGYQAFEYSNLTTLILPSSVINLGDYAFSPDNDNLLDITLNSNVNPLGFFGTPAVTTIKFDYSGPIQEGFCNGRTNLHTATLLNVTSIEEGAFKGTTSLNSIIIPNTVTTIDTVAFQLSGLISITIPNSVDTIGNNAFNACPNLTSVTFEPNSQPSSMSTNTFLESDDINVYMNSNTLSYLNNQYPLLPPLEFNPNPVQSFFSAHYVTIFSTDPPPLPPPPSPPPISNRPGPIQMCDSPFRQCNTTTKTNFSSGNVTIQGTTRPLKLSYLTRTVVPMRNHTLVYANKPNNEYGKRAGGPSGYGQPPKNHFI